MTASYNRLAWVEQAIADTRDFCERVERNHAADLAMGRPGSWDYDFELDLKDAAKRARKTLELLEAEHRALVAGEELRDREHCND